MIHQFTKNLLIKTISVTLRTYEKPQGQDKKCF